MGVVLKFPSLNERIENLVNEVIARAAAGDPAQKQELEKAVDDVRVILKKINSSTPVFAFTATGGLTAADEVALRSAVLKFQDEFVTILSDLLAQIIYLRFKTL